MGEYTRNEAEAWFETCCRNRQIGLAYEFGIFTEDQITLLGGVAINQINREHNFANLGYWVQQRATVRHRYPCRQHDGGIRFY